MFTYPDNFRAQKAEIAAKYSGYVDVYYLIFVMTDDTAKESQCLCVFVCRAKLTVSKDFKFGETNKSAAFLKKFPLGKVHIYEIDSF